MCNCGKLVEASSDCSEPVLHLTSFLRIGDARHYRRYDTGVSNNESHAGAGCRLKSLKVATRQPDWVDRSAFVDSMPHPKLGDVGPQRCCVHTRTRCTHTAGFATWVMCRAASNLKSFVHVKL